MPDFHIFTLIKLYAVEIVSFVVFMVWLIRTACKEIFKNKEK